MTTGKRQHTNGNADTPKKIRCALAHCPLAKKNDPRCSDCLGPVQWKDGKGTIHGKRRSCTSCPMNGKGLDVCVICPGPNMAFASDGERMVTLGSFKSEPSGFIDENIADNYLISERHDFGFTSGREASADYVVDIPPEAEEYLKRLLQIIAKMTSTQLAALQSALKGMNQTDSAREIGKSKQAINNAVLTLCDRIPELREFFYPREPKSTLPKSRLPTPCENEAADAYDPDTTDIEN